MDPRFPPSGPFVGLARLSLSGTPALTTGITSVINFDVVDFIKGDVGKVVAPGPGFFFAVSAGLYLVQAELTVANAQTNLALALEGSNNTIAEESLNTSGNVTVNAAQVACSLNFLSKPTDVPFSPTIFTGIAAAVTATGINTTISQARVLIYKLASFGA